VWQAVVVHVLKQLRLPMFTGQPPEPQQRQRGSKNQELENAPKGQKALPAPSPEAGKPPKAGDTGILTAESAVKIGGKEEKLPQGTVVQVVSQNGDQLKSRCSLAMAVPTLR